MDGVLESVAVCAVALVLDRWLGEPRRWHPVVGFGQLAGWIEHQVNRSRPAGIGRGVLAVLALVVPVTLALWLLVGMLSPAFLLVLEVLTLWLALSLRGLAEHGLAVARPLAGHRLDEARTQVARIVSRDAAALDERGVAAAATESMLENGADAVFASLFWFLVAGVPGVVLHRMINTLDAMWGYRTPRFYRFGRCAARLDDAMNWVPARLTALTYACLGNTRRAWRCWRTQAPLWDSPNAGPVMAAGAGALGVRLGGPAPYATGIKDRPWLGSGTEPEAGTIRDAIRLVHLGVGLWLAALVLLVGAQEVLW
ncbi:adenosylcobinamide-phosphate synthase CbiB [Marinobacter sp. F4218]|uniref:adenosylcobinamide-phosphate synthase CbiB n=1 Tax=Marinobacter sp. F4218 TaxID=2862868 RepID=UPI001C624839|nr:adenosylcobinamide-phosphate synthase CbiB [Marinobacter sp. F4218]MBW7472024.1 adenosylcobinamide-phosphate synthase CbiB [Marinobacter sp. F4218]